MPGFEVFGEEEKKEILEVLETGVLFRYEFKAQRKGVYKVAEFEKRFADYCNVSHAQAVSSGTAALRVALAALGIKSGDEVITQGFTFVATWESIIESGGVPIFTEVDETLNMDVKDLENKITKRTRAIIPVHMLGAQARIQEIVAVAKKHGLPVIEDTAQSCGGRINGKYLGTFGEMGTFSFDPVKTITTGEGGMIITNDKTLYLNCAEFHDHGHEHNPNVERGLDGRRFHGFNFRMMELQGAIGLAQLAKLDSIIEAQKKNKAAIKALLEGINGITFRTIVDPQGDTATFLAFFLPKAASTQRFNKALCDAGGGAIYFKQNLWHYYPKWEHLLKGVRYPQDALPQSESIFDRLLVYPIPIKLADERLDIIAKAVQKAKAAI
ncbi:MAG: DegT/DnrJ/EryC1/StrS family aminotransferase [Pseudomonadota bacterium]